MKEQVKLLRDFFIMETDYKEFREKYRSEEESIYTPTLEDIGILLINLKTRNPIVFDFSEDYWNIITGELKGAIRLPKNSETSVFHRLIPKDDEALGYMILSDMELTIEENGFLYGEDFLTLFDIDEWIAMINFWYEDRKLSVHERRYNNIIMRDYLTYLKNDETREKDGDTEKLYTIFEERIRE